MTDEQFTTLFRRHLPIIPIPVEVAEHLVKHTLAAVAAKWPKASGKRIIAIGRSEAGKPFKVTVPADWPTESEVDAIIANSRRFDTVAAAVRSLFDPDDWAAWAPHSELEAMQEERREQWH